MTKLDEAAFALRPCRLCSKQPEWRMGYGIPKAAFGVLVLNVRIVCCKVELKEKVEAYKPQQLINACLNLADDWNRLNAD